MTMIKECTRGNIIRVAFQTQTSLTLVTVLLPTPGLGEEKDVCLLKIEASGDLIEGETAAHLDAGPIPIRASCSWKARFGRRLRDILTYRILSKLEKSTRRRSSISVKIADS